MDTEETLIKCGIELIRNGLTWGNSGNISIRSESDTFLISASGTHLGSLQSNDIIRCNIFDEMHEGSRTPSMETGFHRGIYQVCSESNAIIHSQPFYSTLVSCSDMEIRTDFLPEAMAYLPSVVRVPYYHAGSLELAAAITRQASTTQVLLLNNHGVVCRGSSLDEALLKTQTLELCCKLLVTSRTAQLDLNYLGNEVLEDFQHQLQNRQQPAEPEHH